MVPRIASLQVGLPRSYGEGGTDAAEHRPWSTALFKETVDGPRWLGCTNLLGDGQADLVHHGGPDKAVCVYPASHYAYWREKLGISEFGYGAFGENFTVAGLTESDVCIGDVYAVGDAVVQLSQPRQPCWKLARRWGVNDLASRAIAVGLTGWYFRVLREGEVRAGLTLELRDRPCAGWTVARANDVMYRLRDESRLTRELADCALLSDSWRGKLWRRMERMVEADGGAAD